MFYSWAYLLAHFFHASGYFYLVHHQNIGHDVSEDYTGIKRMNSNLVN